MDQNLHYSQPQPMWKHISQVREEGIKYMDLRQRGIITSLKTPWRTVDDRGVDGFEWGNVITIGAMSSTGKTTFINQLTRSAFKNNPKQRFAVLDFQFEMSSTTTAVREFSSVLNLSYKQLLNADKEFPLQQSTIADARYYSAQHQGDLIFQVEVPQNVAGIEAQIALFADFIKMPFVITLDHSVLVEGVGFEKEREILNDLGKMATRIKKTYSVIVIILTQMNRSLEETNRTNPGTIGNYPKKADIFGGDGLYQHSDMVIILHRPSLLNLPYYGPNEYIVHPSLIFAHFLKVRNGIPDVTFFMEDFANMRFLETIEPQTRTNTQSGSSSGISTANNTGGSQYQRKSRP